MKRYSKSVIIFDLDSIALIKEENSEIKAPSLQGLQSFDNNQVKFSSTVQRQGALNVCLHLIYNADPDDKIWYIAVSSHNKIVQDFRTRMQWPTAKASESYEEEEEAKMDVDD